MQPNSLISKSLQPKERAANDGPPLWAATLLLALALGAVYGRALDAPFLFDDGVTIVSNKSIVSLWPLIGSAEHPGPLRAPAPLPTAGRPLVNLSFAINYLFGGQSPNGYHLVSLLIHFGSALLLWAIVKRTLNLPYFAGRFETSAGWLALAAALIWALHPLQTEAVIYTTQRTELMMAFFYLATLYCSLRYWPANKLRTQRTAWLTLAVFACLAGMASKEVMVSAPLMILLFERTFIAGSLAKALRRSWPLYTGLASTWLLLLALNIHVPRGDSAGFQSGPSLISWWLTQSQVLLMYLKLVIWPSPLLIHYQLPYLETFGEAWIYVLPVLILAIVTLVLLWRNQPAGYLGAWVFAILAPTSIVPIVTEVAAERRMYLPLAALVVLVVVGSYLQMQPLKRRFPLARLAPVMLALLAALVLSLVSAKRLNAYHDEVLLWQQAVAAQPEDHMARYNLGLSLNKAGHHAEAVAQLQVAAKLKPNESAVFNLLGFALTGAGRLPQGIESLHTALAIEPNSPTILNNLGSALTKSGHAAEAVEYLKRALQLQPGFAEAHNNLGIALGSEGHFTQAIEEFQLALKYDPNYADAHNNLGLALSKVGQNSQAIEQLELGLSLNPNDANANYNLATLLAGSGRNTDAIEHYRAALQLKPDFIEVYGELAQLLSHVDQPKEAIEIAQKGIEVARSSNQSAATQQLDEWLKKNLVQLQRATDAASADSSPHPSERTPSQ